MTISPLPLSEIVQNLRIRNPFSLARYGDGEFGCLLGDAGETCDGVKYTPALAAALARTLTHPHPYYYCLGPKAVSAREPLAARARVWLDTNAGALTFFDSEAMLEASLAGTLYPLIHALQSRAVMLIGGAHLEQLPSTFQPQIHVKIPRTQAFERIDTLQAIVRENADDVDVILLAAGPCAKVLIHRLYPELGATHTLIDIGSLFDMAANVNSRRYARAMDDTRKRALTHLNFYG